MKKLADFILIEEFDSKAYSLLTTDEIINEGFKSSLLTKLANKIFKYEKKHRDNDREASETQYRNSKTAQSFSSIFGPIVKQEKYGDPKVAQGLKWSEITDEQLEKYDGNDKKLIKIIKQVYSHKQNADFIVCDKNTDEIEYFIKGYSSNKDIIVYQFNPMNRWNGGVKPKMEKAYKYQDRHLKVDETIKLIEDKLVYALIITDDIIKDYTILNKDRINSKSGVINYDRASLENMLKKQQHRYKVLVEEMKAKKLMANKDALFDEIKKVNDEVVNFYKEVMDNPEYIDKLYSLGDIMQYVSYAYESYYKFIRYRREGDRSEERAKKEYPDKSDEEIKKWRHYSDKEAESEINDAKEYIDRIRKKIQQTKKELNEKS